MLGLMRRLRAEWARGRRESWEREAKRGFAACGDGVVVRAYSTFVCPEQIRVGSNVFIGENAWFRADAGLQIGDNTVISRNCAIFTAIHDYKGGALPYDESFIARPVTIGRNVWIGMNVNITPGVTIGDGAIIGLATVVTSDVPPLAIVGGQAFRILGYRDKAHYDTLDARRAWLPHAAKTNR